VTDDGILGLSPGLTTAVFGLVGVIVGGLLNLWVSLRLERRREIRAARTAALLVMADAVRSLHSLKRARKRNEWALLPARIRLGEWSKHRELLYSTLRLDDLHVAEAAHRQLEGLAEVPPTAPLSKESAAFLDDTIARTASAAHALNIVGAYGVKRRLGGRIAYRLRYKEAVPPRADLLKDP
jgi:hypothetical protein